MLKLTRSDSNNSIFINPTDVAAIYEQPSEDENKYTQITFASGAYVFVNESAEDIVRYIIQKRSYGGTFNKYDTLSEVVIEKNDDNFDALTEALEFAEVYLRDKIEKYKEEKTNPFQSKYYQELIEHFHKLSKSIVSVTVREIE